MSARLIVGNLDCEREWAGQPGPLSLPVLRRASAAATLLSGLALDGDRLWTPLPVDPRRCPPRALPPMLPRVQLVSGPARELPALARQGGSVLLWGATRGLSPPGAVDAARAGSDRRLALQLAGGSLPGATLIDSVEGLRAHLAAGGADAGSGRWVAKARISAAGQDRVHGEVGGGGPAGGGGGLGAAQAAAVSRLLGRSSPLVFEPWCERLVDVGCCGRVQDGAVEVAPAHRILCDARGGFRGITIADGRHEVLEPGWAAEVEQAARRAGEALAALGFQGPFGIDAFAWRDPSSGTVKLHALCEINPRLTFGRVARAWSERLGVPLSLHLGRGACPRPCAPGARQLVPLLVPGADDDTCAWLDLGA